MFKRTFSARSLAEFAAREVRTRRQLYAEKVASYAMTPEYAETQIAMMSQIAREYHDKATAEEVQADLFKGRT